MAKKSFNSKKVIPSPVNIPSPVDTEGSTQEQINRLTQLMVGVILVLFIGFITLFGVVATLVWNAHLFGQSTYQELIKELNEQSIKADLLFDELHQFNTGLFENQKPPEGD